MLSFRLTFAHIFLTHAVKPCSIIMFLLMELCPLPPRPPPARHRVARPPHGGKPFFARSASQRHPAQHPERPPPSSRRWEEASTEKSMSGKQRRGRCPLPAAPPHGVPRCSRKTPRQGINLSPEALDISSFFRF